MSELDRYILVEEYGETVGTYLNSFSKQEPGYFYTVELYEQIQNYYGGRDSVVSAGNAVYTYQNIPADRITRIH